MSSSTTTAEKKNVLPLAATSQFGFEESKLSRAVPNLFPSPLPMHWRCISWLLAMMVPSLFYLGPFLLALPPFLYLVAPRTAIALLILDVLLITGPVTTWPAARQLFQLYYEPFQLRHNLSSKNSHLLNQHGKDNLWICAMHPHGVIPIQAFLWAAFSDQYLGDTCGLAATTDAAMRLPFLRHVLGVLGSQSASKDILLEGLTGRSTSSSSTTTTSTTAPSNTPMQNLFILPGGVREIFLAKPGGRTQYIKAKRRGLMKLAYQTGAAIVPMYAFGATDLFHQLATYQNVDKQQQQQQQQDSTHCNKNSRNQGYQTTIGKMQERISRVARAGFTIYWGQFMTPMPLFAPITIVLGDPIFPVPNTQGYHDHDNKAGTDSQSIHRKMTCQKIPNPTEEQIEDLMKRYTDALYHLFEQYKEQAGHPNAILEIS